jgi:ribonuclease J
LPQPTQLQFIPLGGLGEFGANVMVYRWGADCLVVDAGLMFPGEEHHGVDVVLPDLSFLDACGELHGVVLTHGHEDHVGALPYLIARHDVPVYASPYTLGLVRSRLGEHDLPRSQDLRALDGGPRRLGPFTVEGFPVTHSIPQSRLLVVRTPAGTVVHTADYKLDPGPDRRESTDVERLARLGREGVDVLLGDSTNADRPGRTPSEASVAAAIEPLVADAPGRVIVSTFSSHVERIRNLGHIAARHGRKLALVGASLERHAEVAERLGLLSLPAGSRALPDEVETLAPDRLLIVAAGSQAEPMSALSRIALGRHRQVRLEPQDRVIHSARVIPGSEKSIGRTINNLLRRGAEVITAADAPVHVSGHASRDELHEMIVRLQPRYLLPIHGEYRQLLAHARLAAEAGLDRSRVLLADSGDVVALGDAGLAIVDRVHVGHVFLDATFDEVDRAVLRDRRRLADDGVVVPVVAVHRESGAVNGYPRIMARGFVPIGEDGDADLLTEARRVVVESLDEATSEERRDEALLRARIQSELRRFLRRRTRRSPLVVPVILEL